MSVNILAVVVAGVASAVVGAIWYSSVLFGNVHAGSGKDAKGKKSGVSYVAGLLTSIVTAYVLAMFVKLFGGAGITDTLYVAFLVWLGFYATHMLGGVIWEHKPMKFYFIKAVGGLASLVAIAVVLGKWM